MAKTRVIAVIMMANMSMSYDVLLRMITNSKKEVIKAFNFGFEVFEDARQGHQY